MNHHITRWLKHYRWALAGAFICGAAAAALTVWLARQPLTFYVRTAQGVVQGVMVEGINAFMGIPYAAPPVNQLRWAPPRNPRKWRGVLKADTPPPHCTQSIFGFNRGQEDCLYLNVWTPDLFPSKPLPVMVWIHGGGFTVGHSYETTPGQRLAQYGDVVVVSINYRLGAMGFMAHPDLSRENSGASGNYGMLDQIHALQWVRNNIKNFGGDPGNITLFGESAGGMSVCNLLVSPASQSLFHKAIIQSGPCFSPYPPLAFMEKQGLTMARQAGCDASDHQLACLRSKTAGDILAAMPPPPGMVFGEEDEYWMPNIDGRILKEQPLQSLQAGRFARVPVMNGNNADEGSLLVMFGHEYQFRKMTAELYPDRIRYLVRDDDKVKKVMAQYPLENYPDPGTALAAVFGDQSFLCHEKWTSDALAKHTPTYSYYFSYADAEFILPEARKLGAFHSADVQFVFGESMAWFRKKFEGDELTLSQNMMAYWTQFAHTGNPNAGGEIVGHSAVAFTWPEYGATQQRLQLDTTLSHKPAADTDVTCRFWEGLATREFIK